MTLTRRDFLGYAGAGTMFALSGSRAAAQPGADILLGGGGYQDLDAGGERKWVFASVDLAARKSRRVETRFLPHGIAIHPQHQNRLFVFEKIGPGACEIDLDPSGPRMVRPIPVREGYAFYGHGAVSRDGKLLYSTETRLSDKSGVIAVRDSGTLAYLGEFPTYGDKPHDCHLLGGGKVMVVTNGGGTVGSGKRPSLTYVDVDTRKLLDKFELRSEQFNTGHVAATPDGAAVVISAPREGLPTTHLGAISVRTAGSKALATITQPAEVTGRMRGEALSVAVHGPSGVFGVTHPGGDMVTFWTLKEARFVKMLEFPRVRGISLNAGGDRFILSYGPRTNAVQITAAGLEPVADTQLTDTFLGGSHILNWTRARAGLA